MLWQILAVGVDKAFSRVKLAETIRRTRARKSEKSCILTCPLTSTGPKDYFCYPLALLGLNAYPSQRGEGSTGALGDGSEKIDGS
jgi:hypothetical protein